MIQSLIILFIKSSKYKPLVESSYIKFPNELNHQRKDLTNFQNNDDNEFFKRCLFRYVNPGDHNLEKITKGDKDFAKKFDFKNIKFAVKIRNLTKSKQIIPSELVFLMMKKRKNIQSMSPENNAKKKMLTYY